MRTVNCLVPRRYLIPLLLGAVGALSVILYARWQLFHHIEEEDLRVDWQEYNPPVPHRFRNGRFEEARYDADLPWNPPTLNEQQQHIDMFNEINAITHRSYEEIIEQNAATEAEKLSEERVPQRPVMDHWELGAVVATVEPHYDFHESEQTHWKGSHRGSHTTRRPRIEYGANGRGVLVHNESLSLAERDRFDSGWQTHSFNQFASDLISLDRSLPDVRPNECRSDKFDINALPSMSVIICFHNEAWSTLLRTVHSVINRTPSDFVHEIILVDDASTFEYLGKPLEKYVTALPGEVRILRARKREGLIRARLMGAAKATGKVLTFLDSHCEATLGWAEPLLAEIARSNSTVVVPVIDIIDDADFRYKSASVDRINIGGFNWDLIFKWKPIPKREIERRGGKAWTPVRSPTMAGGLFAIDRGYFFHLGAYDPGFDIWGGENLEISFKIWMCGGELLIVPCSHVGHVFRDESPYSWEGKEDALKVNTVRLAQVWMDEYKQYFFERIQNSFPTSFGDIRQRVELRQRLRCHSFDWYIKNVYPELYVPANPLAAGDVCLAAPLYGKRERYYCLDAKSEHGWRGKEVRVYPGHRSGGNQRAIAITTPSQHWQLTPNFEIRRDSACFEWNAETVVMERCTSLDAPRPNDAQQWSYTEDRKIRLESYDKCLTLLPLRSYKVRDDEKRGKSRHADLYLTLRRCGEDGERTQTWVWHRTKNTKSL